MISAIMTDDLGDYDLLSVSKALNHRERLARHLLANHLEHLVLLEHLARHVEGERVRVDNALRECHVDE